LVPEAGLVGNYASINRFQVQAHNGDNINWQYSVSFAEDGKRSSIVSYYDGTLKNRQSVAKLNTEDKVIAGSVLYDYQGRPAVNVLPAPIYHSPSNTDPSGKQLSGYIENLNISSASGSNYNKSDFDLDPTGSCILVQTPMDATNSRGAANYYSSQNPDKEKAQANLPEANGFPFVQTEYMNDQTGRVRRQGGLSATYQLGSDHETQYFYAQPEQEEIDRWFGNEVGVAAHYKKNAMIDPNGQASISYIDMHDRVVATALSGQSPNDQVMPLASNNGSDIQNADLIIYNTKSVDNKKLTINREIMVTAVGDYYFDYDFTTEQYNDCLPNDVCFDCIYEVSISIKDACGDEVQAFDASGVPFNLPSVEVVGNVSPFDATCAAITYSLNPDPVRVNFAEVGVYTLHKELKISDQPLAYYIDQYIENSTCITPFDVILSKNVH